MTPTKVPKPSPAPNQQGCLGTARPTTAPFSNFEWPGLVPAKPPRIRLDKQNLPFSHRTRRTPKGASCGVRPPSVPRITFSQPTGRKIRFFVHGVCVRLTDYWRTTISSATTSAFCVGFEIGIGSDKDKRRVTGSLSRRRPHTRGTCQQLGVPPNPGAELGKKASSNEAQKLRAQRPGFPDYLSVSVSKNGATLSPSPHPLRSLMNRVLSPLLRAPSPSCRGQGFKVGTVGLGLILDAPSPAWLRGRSKPPVTP